MAKVLLIDDESRIRATFAEYLDDCGHEVKTAEDGEQAKELLLVSGKSTSPFDVVLCDLVMPHCGGDELFNWMHENNLGHIPFVCISGRSGIQDVMSIIKRGAFDFISKPLQNLSELESVISRALSLSNQTQGIISLGSQNSSNPRPLDSIIGRSPKFLKVAQMIAKVATTSTTVLITGESGTGKEVVARAVHNASPRSNSTFVAVNCAAIPPTLIESELFGYEKGAFTGALTSKSGKFSQAHQGTIFLDEIGELDISLQSKLLRVIQERVFEPVGSTRSISVDVRIIAATNQDLDKMVANGTFRKDLLYRLRVYPIQLPPLRERREDILPLLRHLSEKIARKMSIEIPVLSNLAYQKICNYSWPGNIRELENTLERALIECSHGIILPEDVHIPETEAVETSSETPVSSLSDLVVLPVTPESFPHEAKPPLAHLSDEDTFIIRIPKSDMTWNEIERRVLDEVLSMANGNVSQAAKLLNITRSHLRSRLRQHGLGK